MLEKEEEEPVDARDVDSPAAGADVSCSTGLVWPLLPFNSELAPLTWLEETPDPDAFGGGRLSGITAV